MWRGAAVGLLILTLAGAASATGTVGEESLAPRHRDFLDAAALLISPEERAAFDALARDYQRDAFVERFWRVHDPHPASQVNELRLRFEERLPVARQRFGTFADQRAGMFLLFGEPTRRERRSCVALSRPLEIWWYAGGGGVGRDFDLVFYPDGPRGEDGPRYRLWSPSDGLFALLSPSLLGGGDHEALSRLDDACGGDGDLSGLLSAALDWPSVRQHPALLPQPGPEWLSSFAARSTDLPADAGELPATLAFAFPGRHQSRTLVDGWLEVDRAAAIVGELGPHRGYSFVLDGEVLQGDTLFESFRYRFDLPAGAAPPAPAAPAAPSASTAPSDTDALPLLFQRRLRPGPYRIVVRLEDLHGHRFFRAERDLDVPALLTVDGAPPAATIATNAAAEPTAFAEAVADLPSADHEVKLAIPGDRLITGKLRVEARVRGEGIARVAFGLDGRVVMSKARPPYSVELDLGAAPRLHWASAILYGADGRELARDEAPVNGGPHRFGVRLREPRQDRTYRESLRAEAEVEVPEGEELDRVEFFLDQTRLATLYQPPFVQALRLPNAGGLTYVRVVATLASGLADEDVVVVNAPPGLETLDVDLVELYLTALDRRGRPVEDLAEGELAVLESGAAQPLRRFERVHDLPFHAGVVIDTSGSMASRLPEAERAAYAFFTQVITPRDRAAVITFADAPRLAARFTGNLEVLAGALSALSAEGETALWDTLAFSLHYFSGVRGRRALVVLTDGADSGSRHRFDEVLEYARRTGVSLYFVGLDLPTSPADIQMRLEMLARETGGRLFQVHGAAELAPVYRQIRDELRSQYLLAYQSPAASGPERFRPVEVRTTRPGVTLKAPAGYYPR